MPSKKRLKEKEVRHGRKPGGRLTRIDPSRTGGLRRSFEAAMNRRFARLKHDIYQLVVVEDAFGLRENTPLSNAFCPTGPGGGIDPTCSPGEGGGGGGKVSGLVDKFQKTMDAAVKSKTYKHSDADALADEIDKALSGSEIKQLA